jgi:hypothetical protein
MATCKEQLKAVDQILDKVREATKVETQLKILESSHNIFVDIVQSVKEEGGGKKQGRCRRHWRLCSRVLAS